MPDNVMNENDVVAYIESFDGTLLSVDRTLRIFGEITKIALPVSEDRHQNHVMMLNVNHTPAIATDDTESIPRCPRCGAAMRLRHRHSDVHHSTDVQTIPNVEA